MASQDIEQSQKIKLLSFVYLLFLMSPYPYSASNIADKLGEVASKLRQLSNRLDSLDVLDEDFETELTEIVRELEHIKAELANLLNRN